MARPIFRNCSIFSGRDVGIFILEKSFGYFSECDIFQNKLAGIEIKDGANPTVVNCTIRDGTTGGVFVHTNGKIKILQK